MTETSLRRATCLALAMLTATKLLTTIKLCRYSSIRSKFRGKRFAGIGMTNSHGDTNIAGDENIRNNVLSAGVREQMIIVNVFQKFNKNFSGVCACV